MGDKPGCDMGKTLPPKALYSQIILKGKKDIICNFL